NLDTDLTDLTVTIDPDPSVNGDERTETLQTTWNHPFWERSSKRWIDAGELQSGHELSTPDGSLATVVEVKNYIYPKVMHDLTVAEIHTYYVVIADAPVLVHNCGDYPKFNWFERNILRRKPAPNGTIRDLKGVYLRDFNPTAR